MPPATRFLAFLIVFTVLCLAALILVLLEEFSGYGWVTKTIDIGQNFGRLTFAIVSITFILVEGVPLMLAAWLKEARIKEAREQGHAEGHAEGREEGHAEGREEGHAEGRAEERALALEADRQRREGETLEQALARLESERPNRR